MFSYEERLATFGQWPKEFRPVLVSKLALIGQYSADTASLTTVCVYCHKKLEDWKTTDVPLVEHFKHNNNCVLFYLRYSMARKVLLYLHRSQDATGVKLPSGLQWHRRRKTGIRGIDAFQAESQMFIQLDIRRSVPFEFCAMCGSADKLHGCQFRKVAPYDPAAPSAPRAFYIRWLRGDYLEQIDSYMKHDVYIPDGKKEVVRLILEKSRGAKPFDSLRSTISETMHQLLADFEHQIKMLENTAIESIAVED